MHYMRLRRHGDVNGGLRRISRDGSCSVEGCDRPIVGIGLCGAHEQRMRKYGDVLADIPIQEKRVKGEPSSGWLVNGYRHLFFPEHPNADKRGCVFEHVVVMSSVLGRPLVEDEEVHHKNGVRDDNRPENLELMNKGHPKGQRIEDKLAWAWEIISRYDPDHIQHP